jgi:hypothetical protein
MNGLLSREAILAADDLAAEDVHVPEWGGTVRVRALTAYERDQFEQALLDGRGPDRQINLANFRARLVALTVVDAEGRRLFSEEDAWLLGQRSAAAVARVFDVAQRLSGMSRRDVEQITGNSSTTATVVSSTA